MDIKHLAELKKELDHIFESGANEIRVLEMVDKFVTKRYVKEEETQQAYDLGYRDGFKDAEGQGIKEAHKYQ